MCIVRECARARAVVLPRLGVVVALRMAVQHFRLSSSGSPNVVTDSTAISTNCTRENNERARTRVCNVTNSVSLTEISSCYMCCRYKS